jgi:hypothetical protein
MFRPTTIRGWLLVLLIAVPTTVYVIAKVIPMMGSPVFWVAAVVVALLIVAVFAWRRRSNATRERDWIGAFSFGDVVRRIRAEEALVIESTHGPRAPTLRVRPAPGTVPTP